jgi:hypothetical protein
MAAFYLGNLHISHFYIEGINHLHYLTVMLVTFVTSGHSRN